MLFFCNRYANQEEENNILPHASFVEAVLIYMIIYTGYVISKEVQKYAYMSMHSHMLSMENN